MTFSENNLSDPLVLLSWDCPPEFVPPMRLSKRQITLCTRPGPHLRTKQYYDSGFGPIINLWTPRGFYDLHEFVRGSGIHESIDLVVVWSSSAEFNVPYNTKAFGCPTLLILGDTHHMFPPFTDDPQGIPWASSPIGSMMYYAALEEYDFITSFYDRQHLHWFLASGLNQVAWFPVASVSDYPCPWQDQRSDQIVFVGHRAKSHPYRVYLLEMLQERYSSNCLIKADLCHSSAHLFGTSLISFNCSLNGDLNLRTFEVLSAGGFLLTDQLSPQSGLDLILTSGEHFETYASPEELIDKIAFYRQHPQEAVAIARKGYEQYRQLHIPELKARQILNWVFEGQLAELNDPRFDRRYIFSSHYKSILEERISIYEKLQEIHRCDRILSLLSPSTCPPIIILDLIDLPRLRVSVIDSAPEIKHLATQAGVLNQIEFISPEEALVRSWDILLLPAWINTQETPVIESISIKTRHKISVFLPTDQAGYSADCDPPASVARLDETNVEFTQNNTIPNTKEIIITTQSGSIFLRVIDDVGTHVVFNEIFKEQYYKPVSFVKKIHLILDLGANVGMAAAYFRDIYPKARILCFEPDTDIIPLLQENAASIGNCKVFPFGLLDEEKEVAFYPGHQSSVLNSIHASPWATGEPRILKFRTVTQVLSAESLFQELDIVKIDTEGAEVPILDSLQSLFGKIKILYLECHSEKDRGLIDQKLLPTHILWNGIIQAGHRGQLCYVRRDLLPQKLPHPPIG